MAAKGFVAFDLGAESGRAMLAALENDRITLEEVHRFTNGMLELPDGLHWNFTTLWAEMVEGLKRCAQLARSRSIELVSLGVDTWGVDFGLVGRSGQVLGLPFAYRDPSHDRAMQAAFDRVPRDRMYDATGVQIMWLNSVFQLLARHQQEPGLLHLAHRLLFIPDLLHYFFCGKAVNEATIASTSAFADPRTRSWATGLLASLGLPTHMLGEIVPPGTPLGETLPHIVRAAQLDAPLGVIAPATHDTASAVAAAPYDGSHGPHWAYISSGTWSLMGAELTAPIISPTSRAANFTNEWGVANTVRFLKNIAGLWLVQEVRRDYESQDRRYDYIQLTALAGEAEPLRTLVNPNDPSFISPGDMVRKITDFAERTGQPAPETPGQVVRCCLESLAFAYRAVLDELRQVLGHDIEVIHVIGGGGKNRLLNQFTADATNRPIVVGPFEGTAIGNALTQALGAGDVRDLAHLRHIVRRSTPLETFLPRNAPGFEGQYDRYLRLTRP
jgi:rhamnulokinase